MKSLPAIRLRAMEPEDLDLLYRIENDRRLWDIGIVNVPYSRYALHDYMASSTGDIYTDKQVRLIIEDEKEQTVGIVDLTNYDPRHNRAELGLVIMSHRRRQGLAQATLTYIHDYARRILHLHQIYVVIAADNQPSLSLFAKLGYRQAGILADWLYDGQHYLDARILQTVL